MVLCVSSFTCTSMILCIFTSKADTIVVAVGSGVVTGVATAIINRNIVAVAIEFCKLLLRRHQSVARTVCCPPPVELLLLPLLCGGEVITLACGEA